jgi:hypothetical protein
MKSNLANIKTLTAATVVAAVWLCTACSKSDIDSAENSTAVSILPTISNTVQGETEGTKAGDPAYAPAENSKLFLYYSNTTTTTPAEWTYVTNKWTVGANPLFWDIDPVGGVYPFFALSPNAHSATPSVNTDQSTSATYTASDQLAAYTAPTVRMGELSLPFKHILSQIKVELTAGVASTDPAYIDPTTATLTINGAKTSYTMAYPGATETAPVKANVTGEANAVTPVRSSSNGVSTFQAVLPAQTFAAAALKLSFVFAGKTYSWSNPDLITTAAGQSLNIKVAVTKTGINLLANGITVGDWTTTIMAGQTVSVDGITSGDGTGTYTSQNGDALTLKTGTTTADYTFGTAWTSAAPIYWDNLPASNSTFTALYTPAAGEKAVKDYLKGGATVAFGAPINLNLTHAMSKIKIVLVKGAGDILLTDITSRVINLQGFTSIAHDGTVTTNSTVAPIDFVSGTEQIVSPQAITNANTIVLTRGVGGHIYTLDLSTVQVNGATFTALAPNTSYTITITIDDTEATISATVSEWATASGGGSAT